MQFMIGEIIWCYNVNWILHSICTKHFIKKCKSLIIFCDLVKKIILIFTVEIYIKTAITETKLNRENNNIYDTHVIYDA